MNLDEDGHELVVIAPVPGLTADDLEINVADRSLTIQGRLRGPRQEEREYLVREWGYGLFTRMLPLPCAVDARRTNVTHGNRVQAVALPKSDRSQPGTIRLEKGGGSRYDQEQRHAGREVQPRR